MNLQPASVKVIAVDGNRDFNNYQFMIESGSTVANFDLSQQAYIFESLRFVGIPGGPIMTLAFSSPSVKTIQASDPYVFTDTY